MIRSALKTSASHNSDYSSVRLMGRATNEHLVRLDLSENPDTLSGSVPLIPLSSKGLRMSNQASYDSTSHGCDTKTLPRLRKTPCLTH
jgi:hypothetical protein